MMFSSLPEEWITSAYQELPFLAPRVPALSLPLGLLLLNFVYHHSIFHNPGLGVFRQGVGWSMGTNAAPTWSHLCLRAYERRRPLPPSVVLFGFIDDGLIFHPTDTAPLLADLVRAIYPVNLTFSFDAFAHQTRVQFLDLLILSVWPLRSSVFLKPTASCTYIPWSSNVPRHIELGRVRAECIRYLRLCSEREHYGTTDSRVHYPLQNNAKQQQKAPKHTPFMVGRWGACQCDFA